MGWLLGWNKRIKLTIDSAYIDSTLADFPLPIKLSSSSGKTNLDISSVFDTLDYDSVNDSFTGSDGSYADSIQWVTVDTTNGTARIVSNALHISLTSSASEEYPNIHSIFNLHGDFDIQVDFNNLVLGNLVDSCGVELKITEQDGDQSQNRAIMKAGRYSSDNYFTSLIKIGGTETAAYGARTNDYGKLRLVRSGNVLTTYYIDGSGTSWTQCDSQSGFMTADCRVYLGVWSPLNGGAVGADEDNFVLNSGAITWPQTTFPNRKKIAITAADGSTKLYTEIDYWDQLDKEALLWAKVPSILHNVDTTLYLYYDKTQPDNTYIGDTGDASAKNVWNSNYLSVYHMTQDPSNGTESIKDSTTNLNHLTPHGSMNDADLVKSGDLGYALEFDGSNDYLSLSQTKSVAMMDAVDSANAISVSLWVKINTAATNYFFMYGVVGDPENAMEMKVTSDNKPYIFYEYGSGSNYSLASNGVLDTTDYHQIYITANNSETKIYIDGVLDASKSASSFYSRNSSREFVIGGYDSTPSQYWMHGLISEYHVLNRYDSSAWVKASYYSQKDNLITFTKYVGYVSGYVTIENVTASGVKLYLYERSTGTYIGDDISTASGTFLIQTTSSGEHFVVAIDKESSPDYNDIIAGKIIPHL